MKEARALPAPQLAGPNHARNHARPPVIPRLWSLLSLAIVAAATLGCRQAVEPPPAGKIPVTTSSPAALKSYLAGRDLREKLRVAEARERFQEAVALAPDFALANLGLALTAPSGTELFASLARAIELADSVSPAEAHLIRAIEAAINGQPETQRDHLTALVVDYPEDERAHNELGIFHHGRQEWQAAIKSYRRALEINPTYSPPYNLLGYALRFLGEYDQAEEAFKSYIALIPGEPNPYDSYAELLLQMGRFDESIATYKMALDIDPNFAPSYIGMGNALICLERPAEARKVFTKLGFIANDDGERRQALAWVAVSYIHEAAYGAALDELNRRLGIAEDAGDRAASSGDLNIMGEVLLEAGRPDKALDKFRDAVAAMETASVTDEVRQAARRNFLRNSARVALAQGDLGTAAADALEYRRQAEERQIPAELRLSHELRGMIALAQEDFREAARQLAQANQQDARVLYLLALAHARAGDTEAAREPALRAANFNAISFSYAFVRAEAKALLAELGNA